MKLCECGCGQPVKEGNKIIHGHNKKGKKSGKYITCKYCHKKKYVFPKLVNSTKYCSRECMDLDKKPKETKICLYCGKVIRRTREGFKIWANKKFCDEMCRRKYWKETGYRLKPELDNIKINKLEEQVLIGSLLGDGSIFKRKGRKHANFSEDHGLKQKDYLKWKINLLNKFHITYSEDNIRARSRSFEMKCFDKYRDLFYFNNIKKITSENIKLLDKLGLIIWICDDGSFRYGSNYIDIATNSFSLEQHNILLKWFKDKLNINAKIMKDSREKKGYGIYLRIITSETKKLLPKLLPLIKKYNLPKVMHYKFGLSKEKRNYAIESRRKSEKERRKDPEVRKKRLEAEIKYRSKPSIKDMLRKKARDYYYKPENQKKRKTEDFKKRHRESDKKYRLKHKLIK